MLEIHHTKRFIKELKLSAKRGKDIKKLESIMERLANEELLEEHYRNHPLSGKYNHRRECHIEPDWLLIYQVKGNAIIFERTSTHSDLFR